MGAENEGWGDRHFMISSRLPYFLYFVNKKSSQLPSQSPEATGDDPSLSSTRPVIDRYSL